MNIIDLHTLLVWLTQHTYAIGVVVFVVALTDTLKRNSRFVPGAVMLFGIGALVSTGAMNLWIVLIGAALGAITGDGINYWLGYRYFAQLQSIKRFSCCLNLITRSEILIRPGDSQRLFPGLFNKQLKPIMPAMIGRRRISPLHFSLVSIFSTLSWTLLYLLLGVMLGAWLALANAIAVRLVVFMLLLLLAIWVCVWSIRHIILWLQPRWGSGLAYIQMWASAPGEGRPLRSFINELINPAKPESRALLVLAVLLVLAAWGFYGILEDVVSRDTLVLIDSSVYHLLQGLRTPVVDNFMVALTELGDAVVALIVVVSVLLWLVWLRAWRATAYWLAAAGFATVLTQVIKTMLARARPFPVYSGASEYSFPSGHATMSMVIYGFLAVLISRELSARGRLIAFTTIFVLIVMIAFSRLYLGVHWFSDVLGGLTFGMAWVAVLGIAYTRHARTALPPRSLMTVAGLAMLIGGVWHAGTRHTADMQRYTVHHETSMMAQQDWWLDAWQSLPAWRIDIGGEYEQPFTVQWAGSLISLRDQLIASGWQAPHNANWLRWLDTSLAAMQLPLLPHINDGQYEALALIYPVPNQRNQRVVLRLWRTSTVLRISNQPVWVGTVTQETLQHPLSAFNLPRDSNDYNVPRLILVNSLAGVKLRLAKRTDTATPDEPIIWDRQVMLATNPTYP